MSEEFLDFQQKFFVGVVKNAFYGPIGTFWYFKKNMNIFTPNWEIPEKKIKLLREKFSFRNLNYNGK